MVTKTYLQKIYTEKYQAGFGLVELVVSIGIMVMVMGVIIVKNSSFNGATLLRDQAYVVALDVRSVQLQAVSAERSTEDFRNVYGLYFDTNNPNVYKIFRDNQDGSGYYNYSFDSGEEYGKPGQIDGRFSIDAIRLVGSSVTTPSSVSVVFERPNFDARIFANGSEDSSVSGVEIDVRVKGTSGDGANKVRTIEVTKTGQISVKNI